MKTIIVPTDFSTESHLGINYALMLAEKTHATIQIVHVLTKNESTSNEILELNRKNAKVKLEDILKYYRGKTVKDIDLMSVLREGVVFKEITELSDKYENSLTVLSTHGATGFEELFIGGNAYKITSHSHCPVITIKRFRPVSALHKIVLPLDITFQTREKVPYTVQIAKQLNSEIHIVTVTTTSDESIVKKLNDSADQVGSYLKYHSIPYTIGNLQGHNITDLTLDFAQKIDADLISIMTEQEKSLSNLIMGSYAHQMINNSPIPVLSFPNYQIRMVADDIWTLGEFNERSS